MTPPPRATLADWLDLHGLTAAQCRDLMARPPSAAAPAAIPSLAVDSADSWRRIAAHLQTALPQGAAVIAATLEQTRTDFTRRATQARAFTLQHDGAIFVRCPASGGLADLLTLSHEFGHACQILATAGAQRPPLPPILRETCAGLAELLVLNQLQATGDPLWHPARALFRARTRRSLLRHAPALGRALEDPGAGYSYGWNYTPAITLAGIGATLGPATVWQLFRGELTIADLVRQR